MGRFGGVLSYLEHYWGLLGFSYYNKAGSCGHARAARGGRSFARIEMDLVFLFSDGGFREAEKPTVCGGEEVALHIWLRESPTPNNGVCEQR